MAETATADAPAETPKEVEAPPPPPAEPTSAPPKPADESKPVTRDTIADAILSRYGEWVSASKRERKGLEERAATLAPQADAVQAAIAKQQAEQPGRAGLVDAAKQKYEGAVAQQPSRTLSAFLSPRKDELPEASVQKFIQAIGLIAGGVGGLARGDARGSLAALTGAMKGWNEGDIEKGDRAFADWKAKTDALLTSLNNERTSYNDWLTAGNISIDQMWQGLKLAAYKADNKQAVSAFDTNNLEKGLGILTQLQNHYDTVATNRLRIEEMRDTKLREFDLKIQEFQERLRHNRATEAGGGGLTPTALRMAAEAVDAGMPIGQAVPGFGTAAVRQRNEVLNLVAEIRAKRGDAPGAGAVATMRFKANQAELVKLQSQRGPIMAYERTTQGGLKIIEEYAARTDPTTGMPVLNKWIQAGRVSVHGDPNVTALNNAILTTTSEYGKLISSATGGGVTSDSARHEAASLLNSAMTPIQMKEAIVVMRREMELRRKGFEEQIAEVQRNAAAPPMPPSAEPAPPTTPGARARIVIVNPKTQERGEVYAESNWKAKYPDWKPE